MDSLFFSKTPLYRPHKKIKETFKVFQNKRSMDPTGHIKGNNSSPQGVVREYKKIIQKEKNVPTLLF